MTVNEILENMDLENEIIVIHRTLHQNPCVEVVEKNAIQLLALLIPVIGLIWVVLHLLQEEPDKKGMSVKDHVKKALEPDMRHLQKKKKEENGM